MFIAFRLNACNLGEINIFIIIDLAEFFFWGGGLSEISSRMCVRLRYCVCIAYLKVASNTFCIFTLPLTVKGGVLFIYIYPILVESDKDR